MLEDRAPTWWQRRKRPWCTHVLYVDNEAYRLLVALLRVLTKLRRKYGNRPAGADKHTADG